MAAPLVDISLLGDRELERKLARLVGPAQKRIVRAALRGSAKRTHKRLVRKVSGYPVRVVTGEYLKAVKAEKPRAGKRSRSAIQMVIPAPREPEQAIQQMALEYGRNVETRARRLREHRKLRESGAQAHWRPAPAFPHVRPVVDEKKRSELVLIGRDIGRGIVREAKKK